MAAPYRRVIMKAIARYQIILLGEQRHIGVQIICDGVKQSGAWQLTKLCVSVSLSCVVISC